MHISFLIGLNSKEIIIRSCINNTSIYRSCLFLLLLLRVLFFLIYEQESALPDSLLLPSINIVTFILIFGTELNLISIFVLILVVLVGSGHPVSEYATNI